ncbi:hypothetical protein Zmor_006361 [Zophobas morio]|uniref:Gustatory receptor n=1 Tax=Zophobas morio TaxID=2755281 RepID=A0AA38IX78_9CUCU|nr:hypothetical protein Zmor_006361 [Zophobas morio]
MLWQPNSVNSVIKPIFTIWKYIGLPNFTSKYCDKLKKDIFVSGNCQILPVTTLVMYLIACVYFVSGRIFLSYTDTILAIQFSFIGVMHGVTMSFVYARRKQIIDIVTKFSEAEERISKLTKNRVTYKYADFLLKYIVAKYICAFLTFVTDVVSEPIFKADVSCYHLIWNYQFHLQLVFFVFFLVLKSLYAKVEEHVNKIHRTSGSQQSYKEIKGVIEDLDTIIVKIRKTFQEIILVETVFETLCTTCGLYYVVLTVPNLEFALTATAVFYLFVQAAADFSTIFFFQFVVKQRVKLVETVADIYGAKRGTDKKALYTTTLHFNDLQFNVCGFFFLDYRTIYSMVGGMSTILVYLFQFRKKEI